MIKIIRLGLILLIWNSLGNKLSAQLTLPPSGDNQKSVVTQYMGMVGITINYSSPDVHGLNGEDRTSQTGLVTFGTPGGGALFTDATLLVVDSTHRSRQSFGRL